MTSQYKLATGIIATLAIVIIATAFLLWPSQRLAETQHPPMRIATYNWPGMYWIDIARSKGWFEEAGLVAEFVDVNADYYGAVADVRNGNLDTLAIWLFDVIKLHHQGAPLVMVLATDESYGSEALVGGPAIESVEQLRNQRVGVTLETSLVYELEVMLSRFGLTLEDITLVDMAAEKAAEELASGTVDALLTWEPYASQAIAAGGNKLYDSAMLPGLVTAGMTFSEEFIAQRPGDIQRFLRVWYRATAYLRTHPEESFAIVAEANGVRPEEVEAFAANSRILGLRDNLQAFTYASGLESLFGSSRRINRFLIKHDPEITRPIDGGSVLNGQFLRKLAQDEGQL